MDELARHNPEMNLLKMNLLTLLKNRAHYNSQLQGQCIATETVLKATFSSWGHLFLTTNIFYHAACDNCKRLVRERWR